MATVLTQLIVGQDDPRDFVVSRKCSLCEGPGTEFDVVVVTPEKDEIQHRVVELRENPTQS
jgi:hypothetical protein